MPEYQGDFVDTDLMLMIAAGCIALFGIALSVKLSSRRKSASDPTSQSTGPRDENGMFAQFKRLAAEQPNNPELWFKWGKELSAAASTAKHPNMRQHRYNEACSCFQSATDISAGHTAAWQNWGQTLYSMYRMQGCEDRLTLDNAHTKFQTALRLAPADASLWQHWGEELYITASHCQQPEQRNELQDLADAKFNKAVQLNPELMLEWKKWRGEGGGQRFAAHSLSTPESSAETATESAGAHSFGSGPADSQQPEVSVPWARGTSAPMEPSAWLTEDSASDTSPADGQAQGAPLPAPGGAKI